MRGLIEDLWQDLQYSARILQKKPGFTAVAVFALTLSIGANSAIFSVVNAVLLRPLPYLEPDRLLCAWEAKLKRNLTRIAVSPPDFADYQRENRVFEQMASWKWESFNLTNPREPERISGQRVSQDFFSLLGVAPSLGRIFVPEEHRPGHDTVAVISHALWQRRFARDRNVLGETLMLDGVGYSVIGIMPSTFRAPDQFGYAEEFHVWLPLTLTTTQLTDREEQFLRVIARTKPGVTLEHAQADADMVFRRLEERYPATNDGRTLHLVPLKDDLTGNVRSMLLVLFGAVGFVLLIACSNVANLLLARAASQQKEMALRAALGASRLRLVRLLLVQSMLLSALGGAAGLLLAHWSVDLLASVAPSNIPRLNEVLIDSRVLSFTLLCSLVTSFGFGLVPALSVSKPDLNEVLKRGGGKSATAGSSRLRGSLVVAQVSLSLVLLIGAGLMVRSFIILWRVNPGFNPDRVLALQVELPASKYSEPWQRTEFFERLLQRVARVPGVQTAAAVNELPIRGSGGFSFSIEGRLSWRKGVAQITQHRVVSPSYFETMGIPLLRGRLLTEMDRERAPSVVVINQTMVRRFWPDEEPIGKRIKRGEPEHPDPWMTIVGIVGDIRHRGLHVVPGPEIYAPYYQQCLPHYSPRELIVRASVEPLRLVAVLQKEVWAIDEDQPVSKITTLEQILSESVSQRRFNMTLLATFAVVAMILAIVGIHGVMSYTVTQRWTEIGIRIALGAEHDDILWMLLKRGLVLALIGVAAGIAASLALTRVLSGFLYGVSATDPATFVFLSALFIAVSLLASYVPARRATKVDPMVALRYD